MPARADSYHFRPPNSAFQALGWVWFPLLVLMHLQAVHTPALAGAAMLHDSRCNRLKLDRLRFVVCP